MSIQKITLGPKFFTEEGKTFEIYVLMEYGDLYGTKNKRLTISSSIFSFDSEGKRQLYKTGFHEEVIAKHYPEIKHILKFHLVSLEGPFLYFEDTLDAASKRSFHLARRSAIWPHATDIELSLPQDVLRRKLEERLPRIMEDFRAALESVGFVY